MAFRPNGNDLLPIDGVPYRIAEHPAAPGMPYGQEGRAATVYALFAEGDRRALKVFKPRFRVPSLVGLARKLDPYSTLPGLQVCRRRVLVPQYHGDLLRPNPDLLYSVLMPWVDGPTWMEVLLDGRELSPAQSLTLARGLADILGRMEQMGLAHCDLSASNLIVSALASPRSRIPTPLSLVDVEQLYGPGLDRPEVLPGGSPGYAHNTAPQGLWDSTADRFAGAVLIAEMLGWCDSHVRQLSWGESYFEPEEMQANSPRYVLLYDVIEERWGRGAAGLFERAWRSALLEECPTLDEWLINLPDEVPGATQFPGAVPAQPLTTPPVPDDSEATARSLMEEGRKLSADGKQNEAIAAYREALSLVPVGSVLAQELNAAIGQASRQQAEPQDSGQLLAQMLAAIPAPQPREQQPPSQPQTPYEQGPPVWGGPAGGPPSVSPGPPVSTPQPQGTSRDIRISPVWLVGGVLAFLILAALASFLLVPKQNSGVASANDGTPTPPPVTEEASATADPVDTPTSVALALAPTDTAALPAPTNTTAPPPATDTEVPKPTATVPTLCFGSGKPCVSGRFLEAWQGLGGKSAQDPGDLGFPLANPETVNGVLTQRFQRFTMEYHPNQAPNDVQFANLGVEGYKKMFGRDAPPAQPISGCRFFPETKHNVCDTSLIFWQDHGPLLGIRGDKDATALALFGYPISEAEEETIDGKTMTVQWFQKARFEFGGNDPAHPVQLGLLGAELSK